MKCDGCDKDITSPNTARVAWSVGDYALGKRSAEGVVVLHGECYPSFMTVVAAGVWGAHRQTAWIPLESFMGDGDTIATLRRWNTFDGCDLARLRVIDAERYDQRIAEACNPSRIRRAFTRWWRAEQ